MYGKYRRELEQELRDVALKLLLSKIGSLSNTSDLEKFLKDFLGRREQETILRGFAASVLSSRRIKYRDIKEKLEISGNTISKMNVLLNGKIRRPQKEPPAVKARIKTPRRKILMPRYKGARSLGLFELPE
ncbi:MAG: Trp family transcriptional regulator [Candidatus Liptonbacteria bacterium]|nr:Trp family transcriptional regulator [Candidatus Liptonbacteria bacterium]